MGDVTLIRPGVPAAATSDAVSAKRRARARAASKRAKKHLDNALKLIYEANAIVELAAASLWKEDDGEDQRYSGSYARAMDVASRLLMEGAGDLDTMAIARAMADDKGMGHD